MKRILVAGATVLALSSFAAPLQAGKTDEGFWRETEFALNSFLTTQGGVPLYLLHQAECVVIVPSVSSGFFGHGANSGKAVKICRGSPSHKGPWGAPVIYNFKGRGVPTDRTAYLLLVMTPLAVNSLFSPQTELGVDISISPGSLGGVPPATAECLAYSLTSHALAGIDLTGATLRRDVLPRMEVEKPRRRGPVWGVSNGDVEVPQAARGVVGALQTASPTNWSNKKGGFPRFP